MLKCLFLPLLTCLTLSAFAQDQKSLTERLGYPEGTKLLIVHADDLAVAHAENTASFSALKEGMVTSASVMVPCPWFPEVAEYARQHPNHDLGLHLTLTSEWNPLKWGPVASKNEVSSITDSLGFFFPTCEQMAAKAKPEEVEKELRAQIERALAMGLKPTHLDSHMGCLFFQKASIFAIYLKLGREYNIPVMLSEEFNTMPDSFKVHLTGREIMLQKILGAGPDDFKAGMDDFYAKQLEELTPGVNLMIIHAAHDTDEMQGLTGDYALYPNWCAPWRKADLEFFTSDRCRDLLRKNDIKLLTWKEVGRLLAKP